MASSHHGDSSSASGSSTPRAAATASTGGNGQHPRPPPTMTSSHHGDNTSSASSTPRSSASAGNGSQARALAAALSHHTDSSSSTTPRSVASANNDHHHLPPLPPAPAPAPVRVRVAASPPTPAQVNVGGPRVRLMTSFGGCILPRPGDRRLRYVGGDTRIVAFPRATASYDTLVAALARVAPALFAPGAPHPTLKYQLPRDDIDSLISISSDDDVDHLVDELDSLQDLNANVAKPDRLRAFIFTPQPLASGFGSILSGTGGEAAYDQWFVDALNAPTPQSTERGPSDSSSIISDMPDYLFGLENASDERSPFTAATRSKSDPEMPRGDDDAPAPAQGEGEPSYASTVGAGSSSSWPAPPPPYVGQPLYYFPVQPVHYPPAQAGSYMPRPVYTMVGLGGGGSEAPGHLHAAPGGMGGVYGVPHPLQPYPPMLYAPPRPTVVYAAEGKTPSESGTHSSPEPSP